MGNFQWYLTHKREKQLSDIEKIPEYGKKGKSQIIELALDEFILKHGKSNNPQSSLPIFKTSFVRAIPSIYEESKNVWDKFYDTLSKNDYDILDKRLNWILNKHDKELKRF